VILAVAKKNIIMKRRRQPSDNWWCP